MATSSDIEVLNLSGISHRCKSESDRFFSRQSYDPRYCFELFRRAIFLRSEDAWECIYHQYRLLVLSWIERHPLLAASEEESEYFLNRAFEKMWSVLTPEKFLEFPDLKSILRYLQMCVHSCIIDHTRARELALQQLDDEGPPETAVSPETPPEEQVEHRARAQELWEFLLQRLKSNQERVVAYGAFVLALKPREVYDAYPHIFRSVEEVYSVKENLVARLRRDQELAQRLGGTDE